jgi:superfamily I DNA and/or RNA helicase/predicted DNA-binding WGR domain protein
MNMNQSFRHFLTSAFDHGHYSTDDVIAFVLPLFDEVLSFHESDMVAPFEKEESLFITDNRLDIDENFSHPPRQALSKVISLWAARKSEQFDIVEHVRLDTQVDQGRHDVKDLDIHLKVNDALSHPAFIPGYSSYEILLGHHDAHTDIFCLGLVLGSISLSLDLYDEDDLKTFVSCRKAPSHYNPRIHPTISTLITEMTELDRNKRSQDLYEIIQKLQHYRDYDVEKQADLSNVSGWITKEHSDKSEFILNKLRNRLFDTSRRNRLLYYKPNARFLNLTVSSVPMVLHYQSIRPELLFTWTDEIAGKVKGMKEIVLNKYLRFEDHPYIASSLDKIRVESQRDVHEYGFSQLKLVITFLNWHNLKEDPQERIQSPLLLIPVELKRNKKLKEDHYILKILDNEAEVNPVIVNHLRDLYGIKLPDFIDLDEMSLSQFYDTLKQQIDGANQGITLRYIDKPRIKLVHSVAKQTISNFRKRLKRAGNTLSSYRNIPYSYQSEHFKPLGLEIFRQRIELRSSMLEFLINEDINLASAPELTGSAASKERTLFELTESESNPYSWDFDLCNIVVGNFNYKKMSLVRDYNHVIDQRILHPVFENLFSNEPKQLEPISHDLNSFREWNHVITADPTQTHAIAKSRSGKSYIIQGPPGTGKSQTITNLIADFVARGKSVLFVCEKRAALDVVFHRLKQQGLDELCCYIHDSQGDKREFIRNLKQTYEDFISNRMNLAKINGRRQALLKKVEDQVQIIGHFHQTHTTPSNLAGTNVRHLLERVLELQSHLPELDATAAGIIPHYQQWISYGENLLELTRALRESGFDEDYAEHPVSQIKEEAFRGDHSIDIVERALSDVDGLRKEIASVLQKSLPPDGNYTMKDLRNLIREAVSLLPFARSNQMFLIDAEHPGTKLFFTSIDQYDSAKRDYTEAQKANEHWISKFSHDDTREALKLAQAKESSFFNFLNSGWRNLKKQLQRCYDYNKHHIKPTAVGILQNLLKEYEVALILERSRSEIRTKYHFEDIENSVRVLEDLRSRQNSPAYSLLHQPDSIERIKVLASLQENFQRLDRLLGQTLHDHDDLPWNNLGDLMESLQANLDSIADLLPGIKAYAGMSDEMKTLVRKVPLGPLQIESAMATKTLNTIFRDDRKFKQTDFVAIEKAVQTLRIAYKQLLQINAEVIRATIRDRFLRNLERSNIAVSQLNTEQRQFKKEYTEGRKILENEFGKSMRYKSIRELSGKESGIVLKDLKPVWLMSPLSVSDSLPINVNYFDTIIYDEASQITLEEGIPALYRAPQSIIVGDEKQMPPTNFFTAKAEDPDDLENSTEDQDDEILSNDADSLLAQGSRKLSSVMLGWHYRSRYETLITYSNHAFYDAGLLTIPDKTIHHSEKAPITIGAPEEAPSYANALFDRSISFHHLSNSVYEKRSNLDEARYIAELVRSLLKRNISESIGIVAFSQEQQNTIEDALETLAGQDKEFETLLEECYQRTEEDQFIGLFVKNLENVQGDERDIIIMSVCYGFDSRKKMIMNFGPINKKGGEKRLNVIFSRAKKHMAIVSSIKHSDITNEYNEGANYFKKFLHYAELVSTGNLQMARMVLDSLVVKKEGRRTWNSGVVVKQIKEALSKEGYSVQEHVGQSDFRCSLAVKANPADEEYSLGILIDDDHHYKSNNLLEQYFQRPSTLEAFGWRVIAVFAKDWLNHPNRVLKQIVKRIHHDAEQLVNEEEVIVPKAVVENHSEESIPLPAEDSTSSEVSATPKRTLVQGGAQYDHLNFERVTFTDQTSNKFWEAAVDGVKLVVRFGRIGTKGQIQLKTFNTEADAIREKEKLVREKVGKGYRK